MLIKLRNRFLRIIMSFTTIVLVIAFATIYYTNYAQLNASNNEMLNREEDLNITASGGDINDITLSSDEVTVTRIFPQYGVYFNLIVDHNGDLFHIDSVLEISSEAYTEAANMAWNASSKTVEFVDRKWQYIIAPATIVLNEVVNERDYYLIRFLDVTESYKTLSTLAITLVLSGIVILIAFYFLGIYFANRAIRPAAEALERQEQFISDASHELKTPLSIISANTEVLYASKEETIESQIKWLDNTKAVVGRMTSLINNLLSLARTQNNKQIDKTQFNVSVLLSEIIIEFEVLASEKKIVIHKEIPENISIVSDRGQVSQVLHILLDNAIKYSDAGGDISITSSKEKGETIISIKNTHNGIRKAEISKIFDRFYRIDSSRMNDGNSFGLGLSIAHSIMENLGGSIIAKSKMGEYVRLILGFPN